MVCCPNDSTFMFKLATRCCAPCCTKTALGFVKDSKTAKEQLLAAMRNFEDKKGNIQTGPLGIQLSVPTRGPGGAPEVVKMTR